MRVFVQFGDSNTVAVPVKKEQKVSDLLTEALSRFSPSRKGVGREGDEFDVRLAVNGALLVLSDDAQDVLSDGEHVKIGRLNVYSYTII